MSDFVTNIFADDPENQPRPEPAPRASRASKPPPDKPLDAAVTKTELRRDQYLIFNGITRAFGLPAVDEAPVGADQLHFDEGEFDEAAEALFILFNQHSQLRIVLRVISPLAGLGALINVFARMQAAFALKRQRADEEKRRNQPMPQSTAQPGDTPAETSENGSGSRSSFWPIKRSSRDAGVS